MSRGGLHPDIPGLSPDVTAADSAEFILARMIHQDTLDGLRLPPGVSEPSFEDQMDGYRERYPALLFSELAMQIAGVELPLNPTGPDRSRGIMEALNRIATTPTLFEAVTQAPYNTAFAAGIAPQPPARERVRDEQEAAAAATLQARVAQRGYLEQGMIPEDRMVRLEYVVPERERRIRSTTIPEETITLKVAPASNLEFTVQQCESRDTRGYYSESTGTRTATLGELFMLIAAETTADRLPSRLRDLVNSRVQLGRLSTGTQLSIDYNFTIAGKEVIGYERQAEGLLRFANARAHLVQAYLGDSSDYPLFR